MILVVTATAGYRHSSIETAEEVIAEIGDVVFARDASAMSESFARLDDARVVMFANTTGDLAVENRQKLLDWIRDGGSFIGAHSAADTWHEWPEYIEMLGGEFESHPDQTTSVLRVDDEKHPATAGLESPHELFEEFYRFRNLGPNHVLLSLADSSPMSWCRSYGRGRVFYTALGHREDVWTSPWFRQHLAGAIEWCSKVSSRA